jgi:hypothetical protein
MSLKKVNFAQLAHRVLERVSGPLDSKLEQRLTDSIITEVGARQFFGDCTLLFVEIYSATVVADSATVGATSTTVLVAP